MTAFQLDECLNDKRLAATCNAEKKCTVERCPPRLKGKHDNVVLAEVFASGMTLLTVDRTIVQDNVSSIGSPNSGIIVIKNKRPFDFMTAKRAREIIASFKYAVPSWPNLNWSIVYAEINEEEIYVCPLIDPDTTKGQPFRIANENTDKTLNEYIDLIHDRLLTEGHLLTRQSP